MPLGVFQQPWLTIPEPFREIAQTFLDRHGVAQAEGLPELMVFERASGIAGQDLFGEIDMEPLGAPAGDAELYEDWKNAVGYRKEQKLTALLRSSPASRRTFRR